MLMSLLAMMMAGPTAASPDRFAPHRTAVVFSTIDNSEWCPAGHVQIDLVTGQYVATRGRLFGDGCDDPNLERPVTKGQVAGEDLALLQVAYVRAETDGLSVCSPGVGPVSQRGSNGGPQILILITGAQVVAAPEELGCWSAAAKSLERALWRTISPTE